MLAGSRGPMHLEVGKGLGMQMHGRCHVHRVCGLADTSQGLMSWCRTTMRFPQDSGVSCLTGTRAAGWSSKEASVE